MGKIKIGTDPISEPTHDIGRNSSLKLEYCDGLPSEVVQNIDLTVSSSSNFCTTRILAYLVIPAADS